LCRNRRSAAGESVIEADGARTNGAADRRLREWCRAVCD